MGPIMSRVALDALFVYRGLVFNERPHAETTSALNAYLNACTPDDVAVWASLRRFIGRRWV